MTATWRRRCLDKWAQTGSKVYSGESEGDAHAGGPGSGLGKEIGVEDSNGAAAGCNAGEGGELLVRSCGCGFRRREELRRVFVQGEASAGKVEADWIGAVVGGGDSPRGRYRMIEQKRKAEEVGGSLRRAGKEKKERKRGILRHRPNRVRRRRGEKRTGSFSDLKPERQRTRKDRPLQERIQHEVITSIGEKSR